MSFRPFLSNLSNLSCKLCYISYGVSFSAFLASLTCFRLSAWCLLGVGSCFYIPPFSGLAGMGLANSL